MYGQKTPEQNEQKWNAYMKLYKEKKGIQVLNVKIKYKVLAL